MSSQEIIKKYRKILEKPMAEPHRGYIEELVEFISGMSERKAAHKPLADSMKKSKWQSSNSTNVDSRKMEGEVVTLE